AVFRPAELSAQKNLGKVAIEFLSHGLRKFALEPAKVDQMTALLMPPPEKGRSPRDGGIILRLKAPELVMPVVPKGTAIAQKEFMGKVYQSAGDTHWAQIDPQTVLVGSEEELKSLIAGGRETKSALAKSKAWQAQGRQPIAVGVDMRTVARSFNLTEAPPPIQ